MTDSLGDYLNRVGKIALLTPEEEITLARDVREWLDLRDKANLTLAERRAFKRGKRAFDRYVSANIRLVVHVARRYLRNTRSMTFDDLVQEGCLGLMRAIEKFDPERGYKFSTYAYWWIKQSIGRGIEVQDRMIRLPINTLQMISKVRKYMLHYQMEHGKLPSHEECQQISGLSMSVYQSCMRQADECVSLDIPLGEHGDSKMSLTDLMADDRKSAMELLETNLELERLSAWQSILTNDEKDILSTHYGLSGGEPQTLAQIGKRYRVSRELIRHRENKAISKLRLQARTAC
jgi:RNA polymerase primary sigma factor